MDKYRPYTDGFDNSGGYCIGHPCGHDYLAWYLVDFEVRSLTPEQLNTGIDESTRTKMNYSTHDVFIQVTAVGTFLSDEEPFYTSDFNQGSKRCSTVDFSQNHFRFHNNRSCDFSYTPFNHIPEFSLECIEDDFLLWHSPSTVLLEYVDYMVCFIKVAFETVSSQKQHVRAISQEHIPRRASGEVGLFEERSSCRLVDGHRLIPYGKPN